MGRLHWWELAGLAVVLVIGLSVALGQDTELPWWAILTLVISPLTFIPLAFVVFFWALWKLPKYLPRIPRMPRVPNQDVC